MIQNILMNTIVCMLSWLSWIWFYVTYTWTAAFTKISVHGILSEVLDWVVIPIQRIFWPGIKLGLLSLYILHWRVGPLPLVPHLESPPSPSCFCENFKNESVPDILNRIKDLLIAIGAGACRTMGLYLILRCNDFTQSIARLTYSYFILKFTNIYICKNIHTST